MTNTNTTSGAELITAAQAVVDRWDTPLWKDVPATAEYIGRLRAALASAAAPAQQPDTVYAELPMQFACSGVHPVYSADQMRAFADATHAMRASHGQAPAQAAPAASAALSYRHVVEAWDSQADEHNKWDNLGEDEKIEWALKCAQAAPAAVAWPRVTDAMALAFHSALSDGAIGSDEVEETKAGLRAALAAAPAQPAPQPSTASQGDELDAARYRWLREHRSIDPHANPSVPWVVRCEFQPIPTTTAIVGEALDAAIDAARAAQEVTP